MSKTVLITGASSGIGKATAESLLRAGGNRVYVAARRVDRMEDLREQGAHPIKMDITKDEEIVAAVEGIESDSGGVDVLVNNAGYGLNGAMEDTPIDQVRYQYEVNLFGAGRLTQLVLPSMRKKKAGTIINVTSIGGKIFTPFGAWYVGSKHALEGWSDCLRMEVAPFGINVIIIEPGAISTEFEDVMLEPMLEISGDTDYGPMVRKYAAATQATYAKSSSPSSVIADTISKAIRAKKPRTRYAAGKHARTMLFIRKWGGDRVFERFVSRFIEKAAK